MAQRWRSSPRANLENNVDTQRLILSSYLLFRSGGRARWLGRSLGNCGRAHVPVFLELDMLPVPLIRPSLHARITTVLSRRCGSFYGW